MVDDELRRRTRALLAVGIVAGLAYGLLTPPAKPEQVGLASAVYYHAAEAALAGENVYAVSPPDTPGYRFLYPPIVVLLFVPHALLGGEAAALALQTLANVGAAVGTAVVCWRALERRGVAIDRLDRGLLVGFVLVGVYGIPQVLMGQTTLWLGFALALGLDWLDRGREGLAGAAFAGAALVKLFPAVLGLWLLRRRAWRGVAVAVATGLGGLLAGALVFGPDLTLYYLEEVLLARFEGQSFGGSTDPGRNLTTVRRQLVAAGLSPALVTPAAALLLAPAVATLYRRIDSDIRRQAAVLGTLLATLLFLPLQPLYFPLVVYPLVLLLYRVPRGRARTLLVAGTLFTYALVDLSTVVVVTGPLPAGIADGLVGVAERVFAVVLPATVGMWLLLAGCLAVQFRWGSSGTP